MKTDETMRIEFLPLSDDEFGERYREIVHHIERMNEMLAAVHGSNSRVIVLIGRQYGKQALASLDIERVEVEAEAVRVEPRARKPRKPWHREAWRNKRGKGRCR